MEVTYYYLDTMIIGGKRTIRLNCLRSKAECCNTATHIICGGKLMFLDWNGEYETGEDWINIKIKTH
jgi:hypothetical protein